METSTKRQIWQSIGQFLVVLCTGLLVYQTIPTSLDQLWQPTLQAVLAAIGVWGVSKVG